MKAPSAAVRWLLAGLAAGGLWFALALLVPRDHNPSDGIVGTPAFRNYSESRETILYVAAHALALACGVVACARFVQGGMGRAAPADAAPPTLSRRRRRRQRATTVAICGAIYALFVWIAQFDAHYDGFHEGARLNYAQAALDGKVPYRDYDCVYGLWYGVGQHLAAFKLAGEVSVPAAHRLGNWMAPWLPVAMYWLCWVATRSRVHALTGFGLALLLMFAHPFLLDWPVDHHGFTTRHVWPALLVGLMLVYLETRKTWLVGLVGLGLGISALWPLQSTLVPLAAVLATLGVLPLTEGFTWRQTGRAAGWLGAGMALGLLPLGAYLVSHAALGNFLAYNAKVLRIHASWNGQMFPTPAELMRRHNWVGREHLGVLVVTCGYFYVPLVLTLLGCLLLGKPLAKCRFRVAQTRLVCLTAAAFVFYFSAIERSDGHHAAYSALLHVPLLLVLLQGMLSAWTRNAAPHTPASQGVRRTQPGWLHSQRVAGIFSVGLAAVCLAVPAYLIGHRVRNYAMRDRLRDTVLASRYSELPRLKGIPQISVRNVQLFREVGRQIERYTAPGEAILDLSDWFAAHFLYNRPAPGRFYYSYDAVSPADQMRIVRDLDHTQLVILPLDSRDQQPASVDGIPAAIRYHLVLEQLLERFEPYSFPFLLNAQRQRENSGYALMGPRRGTHDSNRTQRDSPKPDEWLAVAPREVRLGFVPYFGESLFRATGGPLSVDAAPVEAVGAGPNEFGRRIYKVSLPANGRAPRMLRVRIACTGDVREAYLGWTVPNDPRPDQGWRLQFNLSREDRAHTYVFKLASVPQWVWATAKEDVFCDVPAGAEILEAGWQ